MATLKFPIVAGLLIRRQVRRELQLSAFKWGLDIDIKEDKGLINSIFYVTVTSEDGAKLMRYNEAINNWIELLTISN